jgi:uncharacterized protein YuzE
MNFKYDVSANAIYIQLNDNKISYSELVSHDFVYDFDRADGLVGVEVLDVREKTLEQLKDIGTKIADRERALLKDVFSKFAAVMG